MKIECFDMAFREMTHSDIESVRLQRNSEFVRLNMLDQREISPEDQLAWFERTRDGRNWYFVVEQQDTAIGVANLKSIGGEPLSAEAGLFMFSEAHSDGVHPMTCAMLLIFTAFQGLGVEQLLSTSRKDRRHAWLFNDALGFKPIADDQIKTSWFLSPEAGMQTVRRLYRALAAYHRMPPEHAFRISGMLEWPMVLSPDFASRHPFADEN